MKHFCVAENGPDFKNKYLPDILNEEITDISEDRIEILSNNLQLNDLHRLRDHILENSLCSFSHTSSNNNKHVITKYLCCHHSNKNKKLGSKDRKLNTG